MNNVFLCTLCVNHPTASAEEIASAVGLNPNVSWSVGDRRVTRNGRELGGVRKESYVAFDLEKSDDPVSTFIEAIRDAQQAGRDASPESFEQLINNGATARLLVSKVGAAHYDLEVAPAQLQALASIHVALWVNLAGGCPAD